MTTPEPENKQEDEYLLLRRVEQCNFVLLLLVTVFGWQISGWRFACSALIGGALSSGSFLVLKHTIIRIVSRIDTQMPMAGFAVKFYFRLLALVLLLAALSMSIKIHLIGLTAGLSTVMVSIIAVVLARGLMEFSRRKHAKGA